MLIYYCLTSQLSCSKTVVFRLLLLYVPHRYIVLVSCVGVVGYLVVAVKFLWLPIKVLTDFMYEWYDVL